MLIYCHAGCATNAITEAMGLAMGDLMPLNGNTARISESPPSRPRVYRTAEDAALSVARATKTNIVASWRYHDAHGQHVMTIIRLEPRGGRSKTFRPVSPVGGREASGCSPSFDCRHLLPAPAAGLRSLDSCNTPTIPEK